MTRWMRQHRESLLDPMPWHIEDPRPTRARELRLLVKIDEPGLEDRCVACRGALARGAT